MLFRRDTAAVIILSGLLLLPGLCRGDVLHVATNGVDGTNSGLDWDTAFASINYAVGKANTNDTILVSNGVYAVTKVTGIGKNLTIVGLNGSTNTLLDGQGGNYGAFSTASGGPWSNTLRGLTMSNFLSTGNGIVAVSGSNNIWYLYDCVFVSNRVNVGGSVCVSFNGNVAYMVDCRVLYNYATGKCGAGAYVYGTTYSPPIAGELRAFRCTFESNTAPQTNNAASQVGAGIYLLSGAICELEDCRIVGNDAGIGRGGGISGGAAGAVAIRNCTIAENRASGGHGGVYLTGANTKISNSRIVGNIVTNGTAGGLYLDGAIIENCIIASNSASGRAGGADIRGNTIMRNCTVVYNTGGDRGGLDRGPASVVNTIVYFNTAGGTYSNHNAGSDSIYYTNCITAPDPGVKGTDCQTADPLLDADYRPLRGSPAIDRGLNQHDWMDTATALDGRPRIQRGTVDIGAYEYPAPTGALLLFW